MINDIKRIHKDLDDLHGEVIYGTTPGYVEEQLIGLLIDLKNVIDDLEAAEKLHAIKNKKTGQWLDYVGGLSKWRLDSRYGVFWSDDVREGVLRSILEDLPIAPKTDLELVTLTVNSDGRSLE